MTRSVFCKKYQQEMDGLDTPPYPGPKGLEIFEHTSKKAWMEWLAHQTMIINERSLNLMDPETRKYLTEQMDKFFANEDFEQADGYVAPNKD